MFPISSTSLSGPNTANFPVVAPTAAAAAVAPVDSSTVDAVGSALDAPAPASVTIDLSPVANFLMTVSQSQQQITQLQASVANGADGASGIGAVTSTDPQEAVARARTLNDATQNVVNAFNLLPAVELDQAQLQGPSLLNSLVESLNRQSPNQQAAQPQDAARSLAQNLAQIGVTLQPPLLSDAASGLSLDNNLLRSSFETDNDTTTNTLQNTLDTFSELATRFAERLSAAGSAALPLPLPALASAQQPAMTPADLAANARLDMARAELDLLPQIPYQESAADRLASQRAALEQPLTQQAPAPESPIVNPLQASTADVIAEQNRNAQAREASINALPSQQSPQAQTAQALQGADQVELNQVAGQAANRAAQQAAAQQAVAQQAAAQQTAVSNLAAADAAAALAQAQAEAAQNAADALAAQSAAASTAAAQARAALDAAATPDAGSTAARAAATASIAAQQAGAAQPIAAGPAAANAGAEAEAADAAQQARAAQMAAVQAATVRANPLQGNPALAAAIAAYNITDPALAGANARAAPSSVGAVPRVAAVSSTARTRGVGSGQ